MGARKASWSGDFRRLLNCATDGPQDIASLAEPDASGRSADTHGGGQDIPAKVAGRLQLNVARPPLSLRDAGFACVERVSWDRTPQSIE